MWFGSITLDYLLDKFTTKEIHKDNGSTSLTYGLLGYGPFIGIYFCILAISYGRRSLKAINEGRVPGAARGKALSGITLGIVMMPVSLGFSIFLSYHLVVFLVNLF